jgi:hypothetical protein
MTTAVVAKDIAAILDAYAASPEGSNVTEPLLLNYWGFSYGTIIGQTFASMFPDRVGRMVLDGVVHPGDYAAGDLGTWLTNTDEAFSTFFIYCKLAGPANCPFYAGSSATDIYERFENMLSRLDVREAEAQKWENSTLINIALEELKMLTFQTLYSPVHGFPALAKLLIIFEDAVQNLTEESLAPLDNLLHKHINSSSDGNSTTSFGKKTTKLVFQASIACSDNGNRWYKKSLEEVLPTIKALEKQSFIGGETLSMNLVACTAWDIQGDDVYNGPFGGDTKNPILFVSNTIDPVSPLVK